MDRSAASQPGPSRPRITAIFGNTRHWWLFAVFFRAERHQLGGPAWAIPCFFAFAIDVGIAPGLRGDLRDPLLKTPSGIGLLAKSQVAPIRRRFQWYVKVVVGIGDAERGPVAPQSAKRVGLKPRGVAKFERHAAIDRQRAEERKVLRRSVFFLAFGGS